LEASRAEPGRDHYASHLVTPVAAPKAGPGRKDDPPVIRPGKRPVRGVLVVGAVVGSVALGGCAAGQVAQTAYQANAAGGATVTTNGIAIRDAEIAYNGPVRNANVYSAGGSAPLEMHIVNQSTQDDRLVSASSPVAASVQISGQTDLPAGVEMVVGAETSTGGQTQPGASEAPPSPPLDAGLPGGPSATNPAAPPSAPQQPSDTSPTGAANPSGEAPVAGLQPPPAIKSVDPSTRFTQIVLTGLRDDIRAGLKYDLVLTFERAGQVHISLPVAYPAQPRPPAAAG
jgi:copper(I)-binding protein